MTIALVFVARVASNVVDFSFDSLGYEGLHILHDVGLDDVHLSRVDDYWRALGLLVLPLFLAGWTEGMGGVQFSVALRYGGMSPEQELLSPMFT